MAPEPVTREGTLGDALANGRRMLPAHPDLALRQAQAILARDARETRALRLAAAAHRALGQAALAERAELVAIDHSAAIPALAAASSAMREGEFGEASRLAAEHLAGQPDDLAAMTLSAESAVALGLSDKAEPILREVLRRAPSFGHAQHLLANALVLLDRPAEAADLLERLLGRAPDDGVLLNLLAKAHADLGAFEALAAVRERLVAVANGSAESWIDLGDSLRFAGRKTDAVAAYRQAIAACDDFGAAWWSLADIDAGALDETDLARMEGALEARRADAEHACNLHFALGLAHDAGGRHDRAFAHFAAGNRLRKESQPYEADELSEQVERQLRHLPAAVAAEAPADGPTPIFIVGMPRSGSTLLERVLGSHSAIEPLGELPIVNHLADRLKLDAMGADIDAHIAALPEPEARRLGQAYSERAAQRRKTDTPFFTDKLHMNWRHLPLILRMLPQAVVIDLRRDPLDCCWSNYKTLFARGHPAANDLSDIGRFYADYVKLADALRRRFPDRVLFARYEDLVEDLPGTVAPLLDRLGLAFEPGMLAFHQSRAPVATASSEQVREPLNRRGIGVWRPYAAWLGPLKDALGALASDS